MAVVAGCSVAVLGYLLVSDKYTQFATESRQLREAFLEEQQATVRNEVEKVLDYIEYHHSRNEQVLRANLLERVNEAHAIASHLVEVEQGRRSRAEIERLVVEALRPIRFNNGRGYYFMVTMQGVEKLYPVAPQFENQNLLDLQDARGNFVISDEIALLRQQPEGFVFDHWRKPGASSEMIYPKITCIMRFEPFDWYLGTGEYRDDFEHDIQQELLERIAKIRFESEGYIFVNTFAGDALLMDGERVTTSTNILDVEDPDGIKVVRRELEVSQQPEGGYLTYTWNRLTEPVPARKISFVKRYPEWQWVVGAGLYLDEIEQVIADRRLALRRNVRSGILQILAILAGLAVFVAAVTASFSRRTRRHFEAFTAFFNRAASESSPIDESQLRFSEFAKLARSANAMIAARNQAEEANRELQEQLLRARKMEALGLLTGGVAHDLNNILSGLVLVPDLLLMELPESSPLRRRVMTIKDAGERAAAVVADLLAASRGGRGTVEIVNPNQAVERLVQSPELLKLKSTHSAVGVTAELDAGALNVRCSRAQLGKALYNLVANAVEAIEGAGSVTVATANRYLEAPHTGYETIPSGEYVVLSVADSGAGVSEADLGRVFEPFFTKKILGRTGTGLGLTVVWHTVKDNHGFVDVQSSAAGTTFELYLPPCREPAAGAQPPVPVKDLQGHGETILIVDDEPSQREIAAELLNRLGYRVTTATSGEEAVALVEHTAFDLVVLDMIMAPGIGGRETYEAILRRRPGQPAIIASGFAETEDIRRTLEMGAGAAVLKPYTIERIGTAVRDELRRAKPAAG